MSKPRFGAACERAFRFSIEDHGCRETLRERREFDDRIVYQNKTAGVIVIYDIFEQQVVVLLCRLIEGSLSDYPIIVRRETEINHYDLRDLVALRDRALLKQLDAIDRRGSVGDSVQAYAEALGRYGQDVLSGDFGVFGELDRVVKERAGRSTSG